MKQHKRIGLIGDVHARDDRLAIGLDRLSNLNLDAIICTGDIVDGKGCPNTCISLLKTHQVKTVRGNHDRWVLQDKARHVPHAHTRDDLTVESIEYLEALPTQVALQTLAGRLLLCHGIADNDLRKVWPGTERMPVEKSKELNQMIDADEHDLVINGHMHFKTIIHFESLTLINAGTISGEHWPGFATIDFEEDLIQAYQFFDKGVEATKKTRLSIASGTQVFKDTDCFEGDWEPQLLFHRDVQQ